MLEASRLGVCLYYTTVYDCWKMCVMMGAICSAVSLRTLTGGQTKPPKHNVLAFTQCQVTDRERRAD